MTYTQSSEIDHIKLIIDKPAEKHHQLASDHYYMVLSFYVGDKTKKQKQSYKVWKVEFYKHTKFL